MPKRPRKSAHSSTPQRVDAADQFAQPVLKRSTRRLPVVLATGFIPALLALMQVAGVNGTDYWEWRYHESPLYAFFAIAIVAAGAVWWIIRRVEAGADARRLIWLAVALSFAISLAAMAISEGSFSRIEPLVENVTINSYHGEAQRIENLQNWWRTYPQRLPSFHLHARTHPPGPILFYYYLTRLFGPDRAAIFGGVLVAALCAMAGWALAGLTMELTGRPASGVYAALVWRFIRRRFC